jgi:hypothetical protein
MLSAIVVNAPIKRGRLPQAFYDLARSYPFNRPADWTWEQERDRVFAHYLKVERSIPGSIGRPKGQAPAVHRGHERAGRSDGTGALHNS